MIKIVETKDTIAVEFDGTVKEVTKEIWAILEGYRENLGTTNTLSFIESYLEYLEDKLKGAN